MASVLYDYRYNLNKNISKSYVYKDIDTTTPEVVITDKDIGDITDINAVRNGVENIFLFQHGERILIPDFGLNLYKYLYEPINNYIGEMIAKDIEITLTRWEPRLKIHNIDVTPKPDENEYRVTVLYSIPTLSNQIIQFNKVVKR